MESELELTVSKVESELELTVSTVESELELTVRTVDILNRVDSKYSGYLK